MEGIPIVSFLNFASAASPFERVYISGRKVTTASFVLLSFWGWNSFRTKAGFLSASLGFAFIALGMVTTQLR
jgi:hypothetical protein